MNLSPKSWGYNSADTVQFAVAPWYAIQKRSMKLVGKFLASPVPISSHLFWKTFSCSEKRLGLVLRSLVIWLMCSGRSVDQACVPTGKTYM